jgi:hypothetical protein
MDMDADKLEYMVVDLPFRFEHYILSGKIKDKQEIVVLGKFLTWVLDEIEDDLHAPRGPDNTSFYERRLKQQKPPP